MKERLLCWSLQNKPTDFCVMCGKLRNILNRQQTPIILITSLHMRSIWLYMNWFKELGS